MRRFVFCLAVLTLLLAACGGSSDSTTNGAASGPVTVTIWHSETAANNDSLVKLVERFNASQTGVKVEPVYQGSDQDLALKLVASMPSGNVPTIAYQSEPYAQSMIDSGQITPIEEYTDRDEYDLSDFAPPAIAYYTVDGTLYAMPHCLAVPLMFYNKIPFREAGLDPEQPPKDLDEVRTASEKLIKRDSAGNITRYGFALDISPWFVELTLTGAGELYVNNENGRDGFATEATFDSEAGQKLFQWWQDMIDGGLALDIGWDPIGANGLLAVGAGRAVMVRSSSSALRTVMDVLEKGIEGVEIGVAAVPGVPGKVPEGSPGVYTRALWIMSERPEAERDGAWTFIKWLMAPEQQAEWFAGSGYLPVSNSAYDLPAARDNIGRYPLFQVPVDLFARTETTTAALGPLLGPFQQVREAVRSAIESIVSGSASPQEAMAAAIAESNAAIKEYNRRLGR